MKPRSGLLPVWRRSGTAEDSAFAQRNVRSGLAPGSGMGLWRPGENEAGAANAWIV